MPIENERKYVLPPDFDAGRLTGWERFEVRQAYLNDGPRIRQIGDDFFFTYKKWVPHAEELFELEAALSREDFDMLWPMRVQAVQKTRYKTMTADGEWVVDFLRLDDGRVYFVLAEVELPRFKAVPDGIPAAIAADIVHAVAYDDNRFTNKKLSVPDYARNLLAEVSVIS